LRTPGLSLLVGGFEQLGPNLQRVFNPNLQRAFNQVRLQSFFGIAANAVGAALWNDLKGSIQENCWPRVQLLRGRVHTIGTSKNLSDFFYFS
jgi:hypothetical protein